MCLAETKNVGNTKYASTKNKTKTPNRPTHQVTALLSPPATSHCCSRRMLNPPGCRVRLRMCRRLPSPRNPPPRRYQVSCCPLRWPRSARAAACEQSQRQRQPQRQPQPRPQRQPQRTLVLSPGPCSASGSRRRRGAADPSRAARPTGPSPCGARRVTPWAPPPGDNVAHRAVFSGLVAQALAALHRPLLSRAGSARRVCGAEADSQDNEPCRAQRWKPRAAGLGGARAGPGQGGAGCHCSQPLAGFLLKRPRTSDSGVCSGSCSDRALASGPRPRVGFKERRTLALDRRLLGL